MFEIDSFYLIVLSIATIILIITLGFMGWMLSRQKDQIKFPGITNTCPDFWTIAGDGSCVRPTSNVHLNFGDNAKSGSKKNDILKSYKPPGTKTWKDMPGMTENGFKSKDPAWGSGDDAICKKRKWALDNGVMWDTVTNVNFC